MPVNLRREWLAERTGDALRALFALAYFVLWLLYLLCLDVGRLLDILVTICALAALPLLYCQGVKKGIDRIERAIRGKDGQPPPE